MQVGKNLSADVSQQGYGNSLGIVQTKKGVFATDAAYCAEKPGIVAHFARRGIIVKSVK